MRLRGCGFNTTDCNGPIVSPLGSQCSGLDLRGPTTPQGAVPLLATAPSGDEGSDAETHSASDMESSCI